MKLRFGSEQSQRESRRAIREGSQVWTDAGLPEERYRWPLVRFPGGTFGDAWRFLTTG